MTLLAVSCRRDDVAFRERSEWHETGLSFVASIRQRLPHGGAIRVLVLTAEDGALAPRDREQLRVLERELRRDIYPLTVLGPDLRDSRVREAMPDVLHKGWRQDDFARWLDGAQEKLVVSLIGLPPDPDAFGVALIGTDLFPGRTDSRYVMISE